MPYTNFSLPTGLSWLSPAFRPSAEEIRNYSAAIAAREGVPAEQSAKFSREAELQLWVWRFEHKRRTRNRRRK